MSSDYLIILNPKADNGKAKKNWPNIKNILESNKVKYKLRITRKINHAKSITNYYLNKWEKQNKFPKCIIIVGGDGTINEVLNAILSDKAAPNIPIGFLPFGKNTKFAKANKINKSEWKKILLNIINNDNYKNISIGNFNEKIKQENGIFINQIVIGMDINPKNGSNKFYKLKQLIALVPLLYNVDCFNTKVTVDSKEYSFKKAITCSVTNEITNDNKEEPLRLLIIEKRNIFKLIYTILAILMGKSYKLKSLHKLYGKNIHLSVPSLEYGKIDGNNFGSRFYDIEYRIIQYPFIM
ncbi:diacylglycerol/lipid kinase family protein [Apilactobacillus quenuiae]|uniref:diacylglycerol/lipid kinase family protein n=1 Tax=Apilactobacillus quenuiae TaxID=2008377 RepID=UPI0012FFF9CD|nr:diacylglycerol kinase family protein [Apilactobacillus quenuiae]